MQTKLIKFFSKNHIQPSDILYITREDRHTMVRLKSGKLLQTNIPVKIFLTALPEGGYLNITKGVVISSGDIASIAGRQYTMTDGTSFTGRVRSAGTHKQNRQRLETHSQLGNQLISQTIYQQFSVMDKMHLPFFVMELQFDDNAHDFEFIIRYCNEAMAEFEGYLREEVIDRPYHQIFRALDKDRLLAFLDTALTGRSNALNCAHPKSGNQGYTHCFSPGKNLCACIRIDDSQ